MGLLLELKAMMDETAMSIIKYSNGCKSETSFLKVICSSSTFNHYVRIFNLYSQIFER